MNKLRVVPASYGRAEELAASLRPPNIESPIKATKRVLPSEPVHEDRRRGNGTLKAKDTRRVALRAPRGSRRTKASLWPPSPPFNVPFFASRVLLGARVSPLVHVRHAISATVFARGSQARSLLHGELSDRLLQFCCKFSGPQPPGFVERHGNPPFSLRPSHHFRERVSPPPRFPAYRERKSILSDCAA